MKTFYDSDCLHTRLPVYLSERKSHFSCTRLGLGFGLVMKIVIELRLRGT